MIARRWKSLTILVAASVSACGPSREHVSADSAAALTAATEQARLTTTLAAQKDSLTRIVLQADDFIMTIDSSVSHVIGNKKKGKSAKAQLDPLAQQIVNRRLVMERVDALVQRAQTTANQLAKANRNNTTLRARLAGDSSMIADLNTTIQRQTATIAALSTRVDSLTGVTQELGVSLASLATQHNKAFYVIGREDDLVQRGIVVREGGANLLFAHPGRTLQIARTVDPAVFTEVDQRGTREITVPDSSHRYRVISRQSLDYAAVDSRDRDSFVGNLKIAEPTKFWGPSRYLVILQQ